MLNAQIASKVDQFTYTKLFLCNLTFFLGYLLNKSFKNKSKTKQKIKKEKKKKKRKKKDVHTNSLCMFSWLDTL